MTVIHIAAVGDILMWQRQIHAAKVAGQNKYSFDSMFQPVAPFLRRADLTIGNLETTLSGRESTYQRRQPKTGWPMFNCPDELAPALKRAGFDVLVTANNHCMDRGISGLRRTLGVLDKVGIKHTGTYRTYAESQQYLIKNVKGIRVGILSYTYGTNGNKVPADARYAVNYIHMGKIKTDLKRIKQKSDVVIVVYHFGQEFHRYPNARQKALVKHAFQNGADIVFGVHPHVLQPTTLQWVAQSHGNKKRKFAIYSLGNFISDKMMSDPYSASGVIMNLQLQKQSNGTVTMQKITGIPTWVHKIHTKSRVKFRVLPVRKYLKTPDGLLTKSDIRTMHTVNRNTSVHLKV
ncbi:CapA family protein [Alicyclobacillus ferrooxydans]|uniref:Capsule synthesis protein CapA domain-containing protein n=1 Tax=Alicyclobacillus ferrooxydans TaxID=471514 RepID=A0A0P9C9E8_9BACL|nr:CapA family protein [Alicyclobacillus ferrooxydans]KPV41982.1 hypothetical protein AN477_19600 [Alicyclobacillus ferrooxydans]